MDFLSCNWGPRFHNDYWLVETVRSYCSGMCHGHKARIRRQVEEVVVMKRLILNWSRKPRLCYYQSSYCTLVIVCQSFPRCLSLSSASGLSKAARSHVRESWVLLYLYGISSRRKGSWSTPNCKNSPAQSQKTRICKALEFRMLSLPSHPISIQPFKK